MMTCGVIRNPVPTSAGPIGKVTVNWQIPPQSVERSGVTILKPDRPAPELTPAAAAIAGGAAPANSANGDSAGRVGASGATGGNEGLTRRNSWMPVGRLSLGRIF